MASCRFGIKTLLAFIWYQEQNYRHLKVSLVSAGLYTLWLIQMHHFNNMADSYRKSGPRKTLPWNKLTTNKKHKELHSKASIQRPNKLNPFHMFKLKSGMKEMESKANWICVPYWDTDQTCFSRSSVGIATMNIRSNEEISKSVLKSGNTPAACCLLCLVGTVCLQIT
jgi:hypothetical protein